MSKPTALITGCSEGGIGHALAKVLHSQNYHVFATVRDFSKAGSLLQTPDIEVLSLDVTSTASIHDCVGKVQARTHGTLDLLINNAGRDFVMPLLDVRIEEAKELFDTNVWSVLEVTQTFAPMLVKAGGVVCNICSVAGVLPLTWSGIYSSSKAAEMQISEILRIELAPLGVRVITGMIGRVDTPGLVRNGQLVLPEQSYYTRIWNVINDQRTGTSLPAGQSVDLFARNLVEDVVGGSSGLVWRGEAASFIKWAVGWAPKWVVERLITRRGGLDKIGVEKKE